MQTKTNKKLKDPKKFTVVLNELLNSSKIPIVKLNGYGHARTWQLLEKSC